MTNPESIMKKFVKKHTPFLQIVTCIATSTLYDYHNRERR